jgi:hypothetical protein
MTAARFNGCSVVQAIGPHLWDACSCPSIATVYAGVCGLTTLRILFKILTSKVWALSKGNFLFPCVVYNNR